MENQHRKIKGYRELSQEDIDLMNEVKEKGNELGVLVDKIRKSMYKDRLRFDHRWIEIGQTDLQKGIMSLVRSIAQPDSF